MRNNAQLKPPKIVPCILQVEKPVRLLKERLLQLKEMKIEFETLECHENSTRALRNSDVTGVKLRQCETNGAKRKK